MNKLQDQPVSNKKPLYLTAAFYKFVDLPDFEMRRDPILAFCESQNIKGIILLAREGINRSEERRVGKECRL